MKGLASLVMRGISPAVMVITVSAMLSLSLPLFGILSAAAVGLITLRQGSRAGLKVSGLSTLAVGVMMLLILGNPLPALGILLIQLLPLWLLADAAANQPLSGSDGPGSFWAGAVGDFWSVPADGGSGQRLARGAEAAGRAV